MFYATTAGGFHEHPVPINDYTRGQALQVLTIVDRAIETGFLAAAPAERACTWCDFRPVCGPREEERVQRKAKDKLADLEALRSMPLLREFTDVGLGILADVSQQKSVGRGTYAFRGGDPSEALYFVAKGTLQLVPRDGGAALGEVTAGDTLGGFSLLMGAVLRSAQAPGLLGLCHPLGALVMARIMIRSIRRGTARIEWKNRTYTHA